MPSSDQQYDVDGCQLPGVSSFENCELYCLADWCCSNEIKSSWAEDFEKLFYR